MILLKDIVDEIRKDLSAGLGNDESRFDDEYLENKIHSARGIIISNYISKNGRFINDSWVQTVDSNFVDRDKECGAVYFDCPSPITVTGHEDGFVYVGHANGIKVFNRARKNGFTTLTMHSLFRSGNDVYWDWKQLEQNKAKIIVYNNLKIEKIQIRGMFNIPTDVPGYRVDTDAYPVDAVIKKEIVEMVGLDVVRLMRVAPDYIPDSQDKNNQQIVGR